VIFAALALTATVVQARELPTCNSAQAVELLASVIRPQFIVEVDDHEQTENNAKKRWCYTYFSSTYLANGHYRMGSPWQEAVFIIEWTNETTGRYWLQVVQQQVYRKYGDQRDYREIQFKDGEWK
jgi:hypothetical protein